MSLTAISPLDGRYLGKVKELLPIFSEKALFQYRLQVEIEYLIALTQEKKIKEIRILEDKEIKKLRLLYESFSEADAAKIKKIEKITNHDVKAVEYYIKDKFKGTSLADLTEFIHFALTSEDVNNIAYSLMLIDGLWVYKRNLKKLLSELKLFSLKNKNIPLLALTHGQPASPTTIGKELAVFYLRLHSELINLDSIELKGKFSGASGNWNAQRIAYPNIDWLEFSKNYLKALGLEFNSLTTQIEPHDSAANIYHSLIRINSIIKDLDQDIWLYISRGVFKQKQIKGEIGSSTMPHKVNPIDFENSEGNLGLANSILEFLAKKLPISRLQRDLSDSTVLRNQGVAIGYALLAVKSTLKGLAKLEINKKYCSEELDGHWEILAEPVQIILRKVGYEKPYEKLKELTRGENISKADLHKFIRGLDISKSEKDRLLKLTPEKYIGLASKLVDKYIK